MAETRLLTLLPGTEQLLAVLDEMFGSAGTADFLKDNLFEVTDGHIQLQ